MGERRQGALRAGKAACRLAGSLFGLTSPLVRAWLPIADASRGASMAHRAGRGKLARGGVLRYAGRAPGGLRLSGASDPALAPAGLPGALECFSDRLRRPLSGLIEFWRVGTAAGGFRRYTVPPGRSGSIR